MSRNTNKVHQKSHFASVNKPARVLRPVRGALATMDDVAGVEKFKNDRRQARHAWQKEDERYE